MADQTVVKLSDWANTLKRYGGESGAYVAKNPKLLAATFDVSKSTAEGNLADAAADGTGLADEISSRIKISKEVKTAVKATSFVVSEVKLSMGLRVLAGAAEGSRLASPAGALSLLGATFITKTGLALGLAGGDQEKAKCIGALMEVAGNVGVTALTWETGIGAALGVAAIAASSANAYQECK
jgi:hypothetical protein